MNRTRVAALLRELADAFEEDVEDDDRPSRPRAKRMRRAPTLVRPTGAADPSVQAQAARILRDRGFR